MPEPASTRLGLIGPSGTDPIAEGDNQIRAIITQLEAVAAGYLQGTSRPAASAALQGIFYVHTGTGDISYCTGSVWVEIPGMSAFIKTLLDDADAATARATLAAASATDLLDLAADALQAGVIGATDLMVTQRGAGANMSVDVAPGVAWVTDASGARVRVRSLLTVNLPVVASSAQNRVVQVVINTAGTVSLLQGSEQSGATLDNAAGTTSRAALPAGSLRLGEFVVGTATSSVSNSSIRDRRPWARGAYYRYQRNSAGYSLTASYAAIDATNISPRIECSGVPLTVEMQGSVYGASGTRVFFDLYVDGVAQNLEKQMEFTAANARVLLPSFSLSPSAGSHTLAVYAKYGAGSAYIQADAAPGLTVIWREDVRQNSRNNSTTSG